MARDILPDEVVGRLRDIGLAEAMLGKQMARLKAHRDRILNGHHEVKGAQVTDHALVRFLERAEGFDTDAVRDRLREALKASAPTEVKNIWRHPNGYQIIVSTAGVIVTVLEEGWTTNFEVT